MFYLENENKSKKFDKKVELTSEEIKEQVIDFQNNFP